MNLRFGDVTLDRVHVTNIFPGNSPFYLARVVAKSPYFSGNYNIPKGYIAGSGFSFDPDQARRKSLGEFVERLCAEVSGLEMPSCRMSLEDLDLKGLSYLDPNVLRPFQSGHHFEQRYPVIQPNQMMTWVQGWNATTGESTLLPALSCFLSWKSTLDEPIFTSTTATGLAAHTHPLQAEKAALFEVMERHALIASWRLPSQLVTRVGIGQLPDYLAQFLEQNRWHLRLYSITSTDSTPTILALIFQSNHRGLTAGSKAGPLNVETALGAIGEAIVLQSTMRGKNDSGVAQPGNSLEHVKWGFYNAHKVLDWYEKKSEADTYHLPSESQNIQQHAKTFYDSTRLGVFYVDLTTSMARKFGWHVRRCIVPSAFSKESNSQFPHLKNILKKNTNDANLNLMPHPFG